MFKIFLIAPILIFNSIGKPLAESYPDENGQIVYSKAYSYTSSGKIKNETEYGNLTGGNFNPILLDDNGLPTPDQACDQYTIRYAYSGNSMSVFDEKGGVFKTVYSEDSKLPEAQYFCNSDGDILQRWFYQHDPSGSLFEWIADDGHSESRNELEGVRKREIFRFRPTQAGKSIEEWFLEGSKELLKQKVTHTTVNGVSREEVFDPEGKSLEWSEQVYDELGRLRAESNSTGYSATYEYDGPDRVIQKTGDLSIFFAKNLLNQISYKTEEGKEKSLVWEYSPDGRLASYSDEDGNKTEYRWEKNEMIQIDPLVLDENDTPYQPTWKYSYDSFGNLRSLISPKGEITSYIYTSRGQPALITLPDGTTEMFKYDPEGSLHRHRSKNGKTIVYEYDEYGKIQYKEIYGPSLKAAGAFLGGVRFQPEGKKIEWINTHINNSLSFKYGQETLQILNDEEKPLIEWHHLTPLKRNVYFGEGPNDFWIEEGNRIYSHDGILVCDSTLPFSESNRNIYRDTYDIRGRLKGREHHLKSIEYSYDPHDNLAREKHLRIPNEGLSPHFVVGYEWGTNDRLKSYWLQDPKKKIGYEYGLFGNVKQRTFEDKILNYRYDTHGGLSKIFTKDSKDPITTFESIEDTEIATSSNGIKVERVFSNSGHLISETINSSNSLLSFEFRYKRDRLGRITRIELPDRTFIQYIYEGPFVSSIQRLDANKRELYAHSVTKRNLQGRIEEEILIGSAGTRTHRWTPEARLSSIESSPLSQCVSSDGKILNTRDPVGTFITNYAYDALSRLVEEQGYYNHTFTYDSLDNCIRKDGISININDLNQLIHLESTGCEYNTKGNLVLKNQTQILRYNVFDQPNRIEFTKADPILYRYDAHGRWMEKQTNDPHEEEEVFALQSFLCLDRTPIGVIDENGVITSLKIPLDPQHPESSPAIAIELNGIAFAPIYDLFGNVALLLDPKTATVAESYRYSAFGEETIFDAHQQPISKAMNPWRYRDKYKDDQTGLIYFGLRFYDPSLMRWITPDPLGTIDGPNLYAFLHNNPIGHYDNSGLASDSYSEYFYGEFESHCFCERHRQCKRGGSAQSFAAGVAIGINDYAITAIDSIAQLGTRMNVADLDCTPLEREAILAIAEQSGLRLRENLKLGIEELFNVDPHDEIAKKSAQGTYLTLQVADFLRGNVRDPRRIVSFAKTQSLEKGGILSEITKKIRTNPIWTTTKKRSSTQNAYNHWKDHRHDFHTLKNSKEYVEATRYFVKNPPPGTLIKVRSNGDVIYYDPSSNTFAIVNKEGIPRTMFKPNVNQHPYVNNLEYFNAQQQ